MKIKYIHGALCACSIALIPFSLSAAPVSGYMEGWDAPGDLAGWESNTTVSTVVHSNTGGNPNGHLLTRGTGAGSFDVGALSELPAVTGDFGGSIWTVSVDLAFLSAAQANNFDAAWLRFRYQDSTESGWAYSLTDTFSSAWNTYTVTFDTSWDDVTAMANGWLQDKDSIDSNANPSQPWATTMSDVYTTEVRLSGEGDLLAGIDNFKLQQVPVPAAVWLFGSGLIGLLCFARRKTG